MTKYFLINILSILITIKINIISSEMFTIVIIPLIVFIQFNPIINCTQNINI